MPFRCQAYGCKTNYESNPGPAPGEEKPTLHSVPINDSELLQKWIRANPRENWKPTASSKLCSIHFDADDFETTSVDTNAARRKKAEEQKEQGGKGFLRRLKKGAVPSKFPGAPEYCSTQKAPSRPTVRATSSSRLELEIIKNVQMEETFIASDKLAGQTPEIIGEQLQNESTLPAGLTITVVDGVLLIYRLEMDLEAGIAKVAGCISVSADLKIVASLDNVPVPADQFNDLTTNGAVTTMSQLINLAARMKSWTEDKNSRSWKLCTKMAVNLLKDGLDILTASHPESDEQRKLEFIIEQTKLLLTSKFHRHYSPELTIMSYMTHAASAAAYNTLRESRCLSIPSVSTLKKVNRRLDEHGGLDNESYLQLRISKLNEHERNMLLIIDEIYVAKRLEYSGGDIIGLTADGSVASTLLCFMIKSLVSKYKDIVAIFPINKLSAEKLNNCYRNVMSVLHNLPINIAAVSVDNAATNRKFLIDFLCGGSIKTFVIDEVTGQPIYIIIDPTHNLKNLYNNFQARKLFECPQMNLNLPDGCIAKFSDIVELHNLESSMALKKAHRLTPAVLAPKSVEKTSVKLAVAVFCESTRDALVHYTEHEKKPWHGTAAFISVVIKLWNVMNVKTSTKGKRKRNMSMDPVRSSEDWKLQFLAECADFLKRWEETKKPGLSRETFFAMQHTCKALAEYARYLIDRRAFNYVLLGHLQSDGIEYRFGCGSVSFLGPAILHLNKAGP